MARLRADCTLVIPATPRATFRLHRECLSARSRLFKGLFDGGLSTTSTWRPRLLPSPSSHPVVFLPIPDPSSIQLLFRWMYLGDTDLIQKALDRGDIHWKGIARNVEYLGLTADIKVFLGSWYRAKHLSPRAPSCPTDDSDEYYFPSSLSDDDEDLDEEIQLYEECRRGRTRDVKPLV